MSKLVVIEDKSNTKITIDTEKHYKAAGGQATIFTIDNKTAYKIYHDKTKAIPEKKIIELSNLTQKNIVKPISLIRNTKNELIGYSMAWLGSHTESMCKLFTGTFKTDNNINDSIISDLINYSRDTMVGVHKQGFLFVDYNELNQLVSKDWLTPYFIDTDSMQTPSFRATAIMDSIRDRLITNRKSWNEGSDWFSFAIISFQLYMGIHPYRGRHPKYKPREWQKRMDDGVSVFESGVRLPPSCPDFNVIPSNMLDWYKEIFQKNKRSIPPKIGQVSVDTKESTTYNVITSDRDNEIKLIVNTKDAIIDVYDCHGVLYFICDNSIQYLKTRVDYDSNNKVSLLCSTNVGTPVLCECDRYGSLEFLTLDGNQLVTPITSSGFFRYQNSIYSLTNGRLQKISFLEMVNSKIVRNVKPVANVSEKNSTVFRGMVIQDLLMKKYFTIPYDDKCLTIQIPELDSHRIIDAQRDSNVCEVISEYNSQYFRNVFVFDFDKKSYLHRYDEDVSGNNVNLVCKNNGVCISSTDNGAEVYLKNNIKVLDNVPYDSGTPLFIYSGNVHFYRKNQVYSVTTKKGK